MFNMKQKNNKKAKMVIFKLTDASTDIPKEFIFYLKDGLYFLNGTNGESYWNFGLKISQCDLEAIADTLDWEAVKDEINKGYYNCEEYYMRGVIDE